MRRPQTFLTDEQVRALREAHANGDRLRDLATRFGVHTTTVSYIAHGRSRRSAGGPICSADAPRRRRMGEPTFRQVDVLHALYDLWEDAGGLWPAITEIGARLGVRSTNAVHQHLVALKQFGLVTWTPKKARTIRLTEDGFDICEGSVQLSAGASR